MEVPQWKKNVAELGDRRKSASSKAVDWFAAANTFVIRVKKHALSYGEEIDSSICLEKSVDQAVTFNHRTGTVKRSSVDGKRCWRCHRLIGLLLCPLCARLVRVVTWRRRGHRTSGRELLQCQSLVTCLLSRPRYGRVNAS